MLYPQNLSPPKDTFTPLEIDVLPHHIMNRQRLKPRYLHRDFVELLHQPLDPEEKLVPAVAEVWVDERRRRAAKGLSLSESALLPSGGMGGRSRTELGYIDDEERVENQGGSWKISEELWGMIQARMDDERGKRGRLTFASFTADIKAGRNGEKVQYDKVSLSAEGDAESDGAVDYDDVRSDLSALATTPAGQIHTKIQEISPGDPELAPTASENLACRRQRAYGRAPAGIASL